MGEKGKSLYSDLLINVCALNCKILSNPYYTATPYSAPLSSSNPSWNPPISKIPLHSEPFRHSFILKLFESLFNSTCFPLNLFCNAKYYILLIHQNFFEKKKKPLNKNFYINLTNHYEIIFIFWSVSSSKLFKTLPISKISSSLIKNQITNVL